MQHSVNVKGWIQTDRGKRLDLPDAVSTFSQQCGVQVHEPGRRSALFVIRYGCVLERCSYLFFG